jgi:plastocyanin
LILVTAFGVLLTSTTVIAQDDDVIITVDSTNLQFSPSDITIKEGQAVRFFWSGELLPHNAVSTDGLFDSGDPSRNVDYRFVFENGMSGSYEFVCEPHEQLGMVGEITVQPMNETQDESEEKDPENSESSKGQSYFTSYGLGLIVLSISVLLLFRYETLKSTIFRKK